ncbi:LysR substrate-binding domain-containing protein [Pararoseomonas sp. SCSIO 73927]|uniref:LysR substrate-binding domain-containing protein n=1 Tax=Pararoseomonas sp. SCSIO 73927 TaxID=3114537 RepID=UPI0030D2BB40
MRRLPPLSALRAFEAAARQGSFKGAARELAVTPTAISHQIRLLEEQVGLRLFDRAVRKVVLTEAGAQLFPVLRDGFDAFQAAFERLAQARRRPQVTISATVAFTSRWLVPRVADFQARHPGADLHLHASDEAVDLAASGIDLAIRYGRGPYPGLTAEPMFADRYAPVVNPALGVAAPEDLAGVPLIHFEWRRKHPLNPTWERWLASAGLERPVPSAQLRFSDESHAIQAAVAGQGAALLSLALVEAELAAGRLVQPFGPRIDGHTYHIVHRPGRDAGAHVRAAADWLRSQVGSAAPG